MDDLAQNDVMTEFCLTDPIDRSITPLARSHVMIL